MKGNEVALFLYEALDSVGKKMRGMVDAENLLDAKQKLVRQSIFLTAIQPYSLHKTKSLLKKGDLLNFTRELSRLLKAGIPLYETLLAMEEKYRGSSGQKLLLDLCEQVRAGHAFSDALSYHPKTFDLLYVAMIANAEKTGRLQEALEELSSLLFKQRQVLKQLINATLYPSLLFGFCLFVLGILLFYVVPSLQELFEGRDLHPFTKVVFAASTFARRAKFFILSFIALFVVGLCSVWTRPNWRQFFYQWVLRIPLLNKLFAKVGLIRFFRAAATLLEGGVPIVAAFAEARATMNHPLLEKTIQQAEACISQGAPIHAQFLDNDLIPPLVPRMLGIAEKGGNLDGMMRQIAEIYEEDLEKSLAFFSTVAQPILLLFLGVVVGFVLLSVLLPLTDVSSFANT
jgi:general secretion pathway protein F/type IV pilus assembly protein PilC